MFDVADLATPPDWAGVNVIHKDFLFILCLSF